MFMRSGVSNVANGGKTHNHGYRQHKQLGCFGPVAFCPVPFRFLLPLRFGVFVCVGPLAVGLLFPEMF